MTYLTPIPVIEAEEFNRFTTNEAIEDCANNFSEPIGEILPLIERQLLVDEQGGKKHYTIKILRNASESDKEEYSIGLQIKEDQL